jgi:hypothetical protein
MNIDLLNSTPARQIHFSRNWEDTRWQKLHWKQPKRLRREFQLHLQNQTWGKLSFERNQFIPRAIASTADQEWRFKYTRFSLPKVTIQVSNETIAQAVLEMNWGWQGNLIFDDGRSYNWISTDDDVQEFCFITPRDQPVVFFLPRRRLLKLEAEVDINSTFLHHPHIPLLTTLGWFLVLIHSY